MRTLFANMLQHFARWLQPKKIPESLAGNQWTGSTFVDVWQRHRQPTGNDLLAELKSTAWTCASINAAVCASFPPRLYVMTQADQAPPQCRTRQVDPPRERRLGSIHKACRIEEVIEHPLLTLLQQVNAITNAFDLWELTTLYQEVHGSAYWHLVCDALGVPREIWVLPSQNVTPRRQLDSPRVVDEYIYRAGGQEQRFAPSEVIHFRYPDPRDPYLGGLGPLRACFEQVAVLAEFTAMKRSLYENHAVPAAVVSPDEAIGADERERLEALWNSKFRKGGSGRVLVGDMGLKVQVLSQSLGDLAALADMRVTKEDIANAFHVPLAFLTSETNLANLQAAEHQHLSKAIAPRLRRRDEKLNEQLVPRFDPSGRLFLASDDPVPANRELRLRQEEIELRYGVVTINEIRQERGLPPLSWGDAPWRPGAADPER